MSNICSHPNALNLKEYYLKVCKCVLMFTRCHSNITKEWEECFCKHAYEPACKQEQRKTNKTGHLRFVNKLEKA